MDQNFALYTYREVDGVEVCDVYVDLENPKTIEDAQAAGAKLQAVPLGVGQGPLSFMAVPINPWPGSV